MCQNHSHAEVVSLGVSMQFPGPVRICRVTQAFTLNLSSGERWTLPPGTIVAVPCSSEDAYSRLGVQAMGGLFICASLTAEAELTFIPTAARSATRSYGNGNGEGVRVSPGQTTEEDEYAPF